MKKVIKRGDLRVRAEVGPEFDLDGEGDRTRIAKLKITILGLPEQPDKWSITWGHHLDYLIDELPVWTERFYPGDIDELWEALASPPGAGSQLRSPGFNSIHENEQI